MEEDGQTVSSQNSYKVVVVGDTNVGKTSISIRFCNHVFTETMPTLGAAYLVKSVVVGTTPVTLQIWDTAGQERYASLIPMYYRAAKAAIAVYDITDRASFTKASYWVQKIRDEVPGLIVIFLVGNKVDLDSKREVRREEGENLARFLNVGFFETSARNDINVAPLFVSAARKLAEGKVADNEAIQCETLRASDGFRFGAPHRRRTITQCCRS